MGGCCTRLDRHPHHKPLPLCIHRNHSHTDLDVSVAGLGGQGEGRRGGVGGKGQVAPEAGALLVVRLDPGSGRGLPAVPRGAQQLLLRLQLRRVPGSGRGLPAVAGAAQQLGAGRGQAVGGWVGTGKLV